MASSVRLTLAEALEKLCRQDPDRQLLAEFLDRVAAEVDCERIFLFVLRPAGGFRVLVGRSRDREDLTQPARRMSHYAIRRLVESENPVVVTDARRDRRYRTEIALEGKKGPRSIVVLPIHFGGSLQGGVYADHRFRRMRSSGALRGSLREWLGLLGLSLRLRKSRQRRKVTRSKGPRDSGTGARRAERPALGSMDPPGGVEMFHGLLSGNPDMRDLFEVVRSLSSSTLPVIIRGDTGTGKTLLARAVHACSSCASGPFSAVDPAAIPEELIESELLGHVQGAFTGADTDRQGIFELSDGGTLLLDDVANMREEFQKKLLRVLEDGQVRPLGAKEPLRVRVRTVSVTSRDLEQLVRQGSFRRDLYYRLKGVVFDLPPIRDRREDILPLARHFLDLHAERESRTPPSLEESARLRLVGYDWPGNVREIENEMRRLVALGLRSVEASHLAPFLQERRVRGRGAVGGVGEEASGVSLQETVETAEKSAIETALKLAAGNKSRAAGALGITRKTLYRRMEKYGLSP